VHLLDQTPPLGAGPRGVQRFADFDEALANGVDPRAVIEPRRKAKGRGVIAIGLRGAGDRQGCWELGCPRTC